jgi:hypothetical protein
MGERAISGRTSSSANAGLVGVVRRRQEDHLAEDHLAGGT